MPTPVTDPNLLALLNGEGGGRVYSNDEPSPLDPPSGRDRDLAIRTMLAEAGSQGPEGLQAVGSVIRNRAVAGNYGGDTPTGVVTARNQFEPWNTPQGRQRMGGYDPNGPAYTQASQALERAYAGEDPTRGATHFYAPKAQAALGRRPPSWDNGRGEDIGDHRFFGGAAPNMEASAQSRQPRPVTDPALLEQLNAGEPQSPAQTVRDRFSPIENDISVTSETPRLKAGLTRQAAQMQNATRGPAADPLVRQSVEMQNQQIAGGQGTTPNMDLQMQNLITDQVFENDAGLAVFRDPATGQLVEADKNKHVILRDPQDNRLKVFGRSEATAENPAVSGSRVLAQGLAAGAPTARAAVPAAAAVRRGPVPTRDQLYEVADEGYKAARDLGVRYNPAAVSDMSFRTQGALIEEGFNEITAPNTYKMLGKFGNKADDAPPGTGATFNDLESVRRGLGKIAQGHSSPDAIVRSDASAASRAIEQLDEFFSSPAGAVAGDAGQLSRIAETARGNFAAAKRSERVGRAEELADLQAASGGSGANIDNAMRQRIKDILKSKKEMAGFSKDELAQMRKIVVGTPAGNTARLLGKLAPTGIVSGALSGGTGAAIGGGVGAVALPLVGFAAKKMSDVMTANQLKKLDELVRSRSPLGRQIESALQDWNGKANALADVPNAPKVVQFALASRNLVNNLKDAGITISPSEFMKVLQGPKGAPAEDEKQ